MTPTPDSEAAHTRAGRELRQGIQSVELAMTVVHAIERGLGPMSLTQIGAAAGMAPSKAHRYLTSLCRVGLVAQSPRSGLYDLGPATRQLGIEALRRMDEVGLASEHLPGLRDETAQAVNLAVWGDEGPVIVRWDYGAHPLPITIRVGATMPLLTSAVGRVYLAYLPEPVITPVLERQSTEQTREAWTPERLARLSEEVRERGFALTTDEVIPGVTSVAAPAFPAQVSIPLVVAVALPTRLADTATMARVERALLRTTAAIEADLGSAREDAAPPRKPGRRPERT